MPRRLAGRVALVTGAARGIGRAIASVFAREGADVAVNYTRSRQAAEELAAEIRPAGRRALAVEADVSRKADVSAMAARVVAELGRIDILVCNAGIISKGSALEHDDEALDRMIAVNVRGVIHAVQAATPGMIERR